jgi:hypothetical protein
MEIIHPPTHNDPVLAEHVAYGMKPYVELEMHAKELGIGHIATEMATHANNAADSVEQVFLSNSTEESQDTAETERVSVESLREMLKDSKVVGHLSFNAMEIPEDYRDGSFGLTSFGSLRAKESDTFGATHSGIFETIAKTQTPKDIKRSFVERDVPETLTTTTFAKRKFNIINPSSPKAEEPLTILTYETVTADSPNRKYSYPEHANRPGNDLRLHILLPQSSAETFLQATQDDPEAIRSAVDMLMTEQVGAGQGWEEMKPPYEDWREANEGVRRMAFRTNLDQPADQARVVDF